ncbi:MAG: prepilin-type N-terminal cleavage/methylation domain-containing protein [Candidatus Omnitrophica bacterium]|nr:prepilin-type N-terminal cleavage/methylation domain-containing protein [Candidatus Omnitrophota bacterium]
MKKGFTLLEILIVVSILAILAMAVIPNFIGFDSEARIAATKSNLDMLRSRITLFRAKEGRYPESLEELVTETYNDVGIEKEYLEELPAELISDKKGNNTYDDLPLSDPVPNDGGWVYITDKAKVLVDITDELDQDWGDYKGEIPSKW